MEYFKYKMEPFIDDDHLIIGDYKIINKIGEGAFGAVYKAIDTETKEYVALKQIPVYIESIALRKILREILLLKGLKHDNLISLKDAFIYNQDKKTYVIFIMKLMKYNLKTLLDHKRNEITTDHIKLYMFEIFVGLAYLHNNKIVHRDLKPDNVLVNIENEITIADFGWARKIADTDKNITKIISNIHYRAPEIALGTDVQGSPVDIWSVGCIFYELLEKKTLFKQKTNGDLLRSIFQLFGRPTFIDLEFVKERTDIIQFVDSLPPIPKREPASYLTNPLIDANCRDLFNSCLEFNPKNRITALNALQHPYFKELFSVEEVKTALIDHSSLIDFSFENNENLQNIDLLKTISKELNSIKKKEKKSYWD